MKMRSIIALIALVVATACLSGCETMAAFGTGKMRTSDLAYLTETGIGGSAGSLCEQGDGCVTDSCGSRVNDVDHWIRQNLW